MNEIISDERLKALLLAQNQEVNNPVLLDAQEQAAKTNDWKFVYQLSKVAGLETSVLIDAEGRIQIDWGSPGLVPLKPFFGAKAPFSIWVHTHPSMSAYWSITDRRSLAHSTGILERAMVLGEEGFKIAKNTLHISTPVDYRLGDNTQLALWTDEEVISWE